MPKALKHNHVIKQLYALRLGKINMILFFSKIVIQCIPTNYDNGRRRRWFADTRGDVE